MSTAGRALRLLLLGRPPGEMDVAAAAPPAENEHDRGLLVLAEYGPNRGVARVSLSAADYAGLDAAARNIRAAIAGQDSSFPEADLEAFGKRLFDLVFDSDSAAFSLLRTSEGTAAPVPVQLFIEAPVLADLPWELLYDPQHQLFLARRKHPLCRSVFTQALIPEDTIALRTTRMLLVIGADAGISSAAEKDRVVGEFRSFFGSSQSLIDEVTPHSLDELDNFLTAGDYEILHFFGHGGYDLAKRRAYVKFQDGDQEVRCYAGDFANQLAGRGLRLAFLNACKTARGSAADGPIRSSLSGALLAAGIPAVIGSHFDLPDRAGHFFAGRLYNHLLLGETVTLAMRRALDAVQSATGARAFDWAIPALYTTDPDLTLSRKPGAPEVHRPGNAPESLPAPGSELRPPKPAPQAELPPGVMAETTQSMAHNARLRVSVMDLDTHLASLKELLIAANGAQTYFGFELAFHPVALGYLRKKGSPNLFVPNLEQMLSGEATRLGVDHVVCLTLQKLADEDTDDLFAAVLGPSDQVSVISLDGVQQLADVAKVSLERAVLYLVLCALLAAKPFELGYHPETAGCPLDYCDNRADLVQGLMATKFQHQDCRNKIQDTAALAAIDALLALDLPPK